MAHRFEFNNDLQIMLMECIGNRWATWFRKHLTSGWGLYLLLTSSHNANIRRVLSKDCIRMGKKRERKRWGRVKNSFSIPSESGWTRWNGDLHHRWLYWLWSAIPQAQSVEGLALVVVLLPAFWMTISQEWNEKKKKLNSQMLYEIG